MIGYLKKLCNEINDNKIILFLLVLGQILIIIAPFIFTREGLLFGFDSNTGAIGDTIGGSTAPIIGSINIIIVYYALKTQMKANSLIQDQINNQYKIDQIKYLTSFIEYEIGEFEFSDKKGVKAVNNIILLISNGNSLNGTIFYQFIENLLQTCLECRKEIISIKSDNLKKTHEFIFKKKILDKIQFNLMLNSNDPNFKKLIINLIY